MKSLILFFDFLVVWKFSFISMVDRLVAPGGPHKLFEIFRHRFGLSRMENREWIDLKVKKNHFYFAFRFFQARSIHS